MHLTAGPSEALLARRACDPLALRSTDPVEPSPYAGDAAGLPVSLPVSPLQQLKGTVSVISARVTHNPSVKGWNFPTQGAAPANRGKLPRAEAEPGICSWAPEQPSIWTKSEKKSDNGATVLAPQAIVLFLAPRWAVQATGRHGLGLPPVGGSPRQRGRDPASRERRSRIPHQTRLPWPSWGTGAAGPRLTLSRLLTQSPKPAAWIGFLAFRPTTGRLSRKTTGACQESAVSQISK